MEIFNKIFVRIKLFQTCKVLRIMPGTCWTQINVSYLLLLLILTTLSRSHNISASVFSPVKQGVIVTSPSWGRFKWDEVSESTLKTRGSNYRLKAFRGQLLREPREMRDEVEGDRESWKLWAKRQTNTAPALWSRRCFQWSRKSRLLCKISSFWMLTIEPDSCKTLWGPIKTRVQAPDLWLVINFYNYYLIKQWGWENCENSWHDN